MRLLFLLKQLKPAFFGMALLHMWIYCSTHRPSEVTSVSLMAVMYLFLTVSLVLTYLLFRRQGQDGPSARFHAADICCVVAMGLAGILVAVPPAAIPEEVSVVFAGVLGGPGMGWLYARWCQFYARLDIHLSAPLIFFTMALGSAGKTVIDYLPAVPAACLLALLPVASIACLRSSLALLDTGGSPAPAAVDSVGPAGGTAGSAAAPGTGPAAEAAAAVAADGTAAAANATASSPAPLFYNRRTVGSLGRMAAGVAIYSLTIGIIQSVLLEFIPGNTPIVLVHHLIEIVLSLLIVGWVCIGKRGLDFSRTWKLISVLIATALIFAPHISTGQLDYLLTLVRTAQTFLIIFLFLAAADIARHSAFHPIALFSLGWCAYALPFAVGKIIGDHMTATGADSTLWLSIIVWVLVVVILFVLDQSSVGNRLIFAGLNDVDDPDSLAQRIGSMQQELAQLEGQNHDQRDLVALRCDALAAGSHLTPREHEILDLMVRGRTKAHIADAFFISENTVRNHVKHIYTKLDVHNRQELIDLVESTEV